MHQPFFAHDPRDIDEHAPMQESPFWAWLEEHPIGVYHQAVLRYLGIDHLPRELRRGCLEEDQHNCYKYIHQHFWFVELRKPQPKKSVKPQPITPPELISVIDKYGMRPLVYPK